MRDSFLSTTCGIQYPAYVQHVFQHLWLGKWFLVGAAGEKADSNASERRSKGPLFSRDAPEVFLYMAAMGQHRLST